MRSGRTGSAVGGLRPFVWRPTIALAARDAAVGMVPSVGSRPAAARELGRAGRTDIARRNGAGAGKSDRLRFRRPKTGQERGRGPVLRRPRGTRRSSRRGTSSIYLPTREGLAAERQQINLAELLDRWTGIAPARQHPTNMLIYPSGSRNHHAYRDMNQTEFNHLLSQIKALPPKQMRRLREQLDRQLAAPAGDRCRRGPIP